MKKHTTKRALLSSALSLLLCVAMLIGTTFAWFTDSVTSANNIIKSGNLNVTMEWKDATTNGKQPTYIDASDGAIFNYDLWEPGYVEAKNVKISNIGSLALKYQLNIIANGTVSELADVIDVYYADGEYTLENRKMADLTYVGTLTDVLKKMPANASGELLAGKSATVTIALKMQESAGNEYQNLAIGSDFSVQLLATQLTYEEDSFDDQYDENAGFYPAGKTDVGPNKLNVLSNGIASYDDKTKTYTVAVNTVGQGGLNVAQGNKYYAGITVNVAGYGEGATVSFDKDDDTIVWKLADEEKDGFIKEGVHQQWTSVGTNRAYRYDIDGDGVTDFTVVNDASKAKVEVATKADLEKVLEVGTSAILTKDIDLDVDGKAMTVEKGKEVSIDLNGNDIIGTTTASDASQILFEVKGKLTVDGEGTIALYDESNAAFNEGYENAAIYVNGGEANLNGGTIVCKSKGEAMAYAADAVGGGSVINVDGATLYSSYIGIRSFPTASGGINTINFKSGIICGAKKGYDLWTQEGNGTSVVNNTSGIECTTQELYGVMYYFDGSVTL